MQNLMVGPRVPDGKPRGPHPGAVKGEILQGPIIRVVKFKGSFGRPTARVGPLWLLAGVIGFEDNPTARRARTPRKDVLIVGAGAEPHPEVIPGDRSINYVVVLAIERH